MSRVDACSSLLHFARMQPHQPRAVRTVPALYAVHEAVRPAGDDGKGSM